MLEPAVDHLATVATAIAVIDAATVSPRTETVAFPDAAGRVLVEAVRADRDYPPFDKALMDGYAVRAADRGPRRRTGEIPAGHADARPLAAGACVAIMTGAPLPPGADSVVPIERVTVTDDAITFTGPLAAGDAVAPRGMEGRAADVVLPAGTRLGPAQLAVAAQVGAARLGVFARPRVGILSTGDEVVPFDATPTGAQVRNGNTPMLAALVRGYGADPIELGHATDTPAAIAAKLQTPGLDAVLVTGGMSMGVYDYTPRVLTDLSYDLAVTKLKIKPGKPFVFAVRGTRDEGLGTREIRQTPTPVFAQSPVPKAQSLHSPVVFGLPGNPVSAFVCTVRLVSRYLLRAGGASPEPAWAVADLADALPANGPREFYQPAVVDAGIARVLAWNGSADLFTLARANALLVRSAGEAALPQGSVVTLLRLP